MLSAPLHGWTTFSLGGLEYEVSYLVDIPFEWLIACKTALEHNIPASFFLELEGEHCLLTSYQSATHIIHCDHEDVYTLHTVEDVDVLALSRMLVHDIRAYFDEWVKWYPFEETDEDLLRRRAALTTLLAETDAAITAAEERRRPNPPQ